MAFANLSETLLRETVSTIDPLPWPLFSRGKVRDIFSVGDHLLLIATDRISAYDHALQPGIPGKGILLTQISRWWFNQVDGIVPLQILPQEEEERCLASLQLSPALRARSMVVRKCRPLPVECVVRGYLTGSGWEAYQKDGRIQEQPLPPGLQEADRLPQPLFTPTTKEKEDRPLSLAEAGELLGQDLFTTVRDLSLALYRKAEPLARQAGMILADTKFEFGLDDSGKVTLIDEVLTPDSSRYWPVDGYHTGQAQPSFDKQFVRDFLRRSGWQKGQPVPVLPPEVVEGTRQRYQEAWDRLQANHPE